MKVTEGELYTIDSITIINNMNISSIRHLCRSDMSLPTGTIGRYLSPTATGPYYRFRIRFHCPICGNKHSFNGILADSEITPMNNLLSDTQVPSKI